MRFIRDLSTALALVILTMLLAMVRMSWHAYGRVAAEAGRADRPGPTEAAERMRPNILVNGVVEQYERPGGPTVMGELRVDQAQRLLPVLSAIRGYLRGDLTQGPLIERNFDVFTAFQFDEYMQSWYAAQRAPDDPEALYAKFEHIVRATCLTGVRANQETPRQTGEARLARRGPRDASRMVVPPPVADTSRSAGVAAAPPAPPAPPGTRPPGAGQPRYGGMSRGQLEALVQKTPDQAELWQELAIARLDGRDVHGAITAYRNAIRINPGSASIHGDLSRALVRQKMMREALHEVDQAVAAVKGSKTLRACAGIRAGQTVALVGCDGGYFVLLLARWIVPGGRLLVMDPQPSDLALVQALRTREKWTEVEIVPGTPTDSALAPDSVDVIMVHQSLAEYSSLENDGRSGDAWVSSLRRALKKNGRIVVLEPVPETMLLASRQLRRVGFRLLPSFEFEEIGSVIVAAPGGK
ncbi:MAG: methyltransferase domain-containing protein [Armatimonadetes bacterium]|nr:methyltransferase domain-containing protein [Armatimonadota bacterium]